MYGGMSIEVTYAGVTVKVTDIPTERRSDHDGQNGSFKSIDTFSEEGIKKIIVETIKASLEKKGGTSE